MAVSLSPFLCLSILSGCERDGADGTPAARFYLEDRSAAAQHEVESLRCFPEARVLRGRQKFNLVQLITRGSPERQRTDRLQ